ncbi:hypothetical protein EXIGLDRAFT_108405 [Exidia glandulosa HHB12029]|uniref:Uncharacterized protein n=1 Tax=Exidia glandulosa HHB12029 TaxID=1314781 RepID=A0A165GRT7_EXIGL|nr:hypothetical protein EXIGLDRAFT_108405 [Exidia glandulosa HHB12029]
MFTPLPSMNRVRWKFWIHRENESPHLLERPDDASHTYGPPYMLLVPQCAPTGFVVHRSSHHQQARFTALRNNLRAVAVVPPELSLQRTLTQLSLVLFASSTSQPGWPRCRLGPALPFTLHWLHPMYAVDPPRCKRVCALVQRRRLCSRHKRPPVCRRTILAVFQLEIIRSEHTD